MARIAPMPSPEAAPRSPPPVRLAAVALPSEHGGWGFVAEGLCLTLLATPLAAGIPLAVAALFGFLGYQPLRLWLDDRLRRRSVPRTRLAARVAAGAGAVAAVAFGAALLRSPSPVALLVPASLSATLVALLLGLALRGRGRTLAAELLGASAPGGVAAAAAAGQDLGTAAAIGLWALLLGRGIPAVLLLRVRLRRDREQAASALACHLAHGAVATGSAALAVAGALPAAAAAVFWVLWLRALVVLRWRRPLRPQVLGLAELALGVVAAVALGLTLPPSAPR